MKYKSKNIDAIDVLYSADWINDLEKEIHFKWYYHQARLVYDQCTREDNILEIGIGTGLLSDLLKKRKWQIQTLDIDEGKNPDICGSALDFDYLSAKVNVVLAFEIFEHIPYSTFQKLVEHLSAAKVEGIYFSLPWNEYRLVDFTLSLPRIDNINFRLTIKRGKIATPAHFWELSKTEKNLNEKQLVNLDSMISLFDKHGFEMTALNKIGCIQYFQAKMTHNNV